MGMERKAIDGVYEKAELEFYRSETRRPGVARSRAESPDYGVCEMKKEISFFLILMLLSASCFAMGGTKPAKEACADNKTKVVCVPIYGDPYFPNYRYETAPVNSLGSVLTVDANGKAIINYKLDASGNKIPTPECSTVAKVQVYDINGNLKLVPEKYCHYADKASYEPQGYYDCRQTQLKSC
jgi:hypothetical protein